MKLPLLQGEGLRDAPPEAEPTPGVTEGLPDADFDSTLALAPALIVGVVELVPEKVATEAVPQGEALPLTVALGDTEADPVVDGLPENVAEKVSVAVSEDVAEPLPLARGVPE